MALLSVNEIKDLMSISFPSCVSIFLPAHKVGTDVRQNIIRLKNAFAAAQEKLQGNGSKKAEIDELLAPARFLIDDTLFWSHVSEGLALFLAPKFFRLYRLTIPVSEMMIVGENFHLKPLMPLLTGDGRFYILGLSLNHVRLWEASRDGARQIDLHDIPTRLSDVVGYDWRFKTLQFHTRAPRVKNDQRYAVYYGHAASDLEDREVDRFLQLVDHGIRELLTDLKNPLVLAGVERTRAAFLKISKYPVLVREGVEGNPIDLDDKALHQRAWSIVQPLFVADRERAMMKYRELIGTDGASQDLKTILRAAYDGRVEAIMVSLEDHVWGRYDSQNNTLELHPEPNVNSVDLLDLAACQSLLHASLVYALTHQEMPDDGPIHALFRY